LGAAYGFTLVEVMMGAMILGILTLAFCACLSTGFTIVQSVRENLRATQILLQRTEAIRLFNWNQLQDTNYLKPTFIEAYDPSSTANAGATYYGTVVSSPSTNLPAAYSANVKTITISLSWTNYVGRQRIPRNRQLQTEVARYGMQNYVFGSL